MSKDSSFILKVCDWITKYFIYVAVFLTPVFFLPWTSDALDFNKQAVLVVLLLLALFAWMARVLIVGKMPLNINKIHIVVGVAFLVYLLATVFSIYGYGSFWGWPQSTSDSLLSFMVAALAYFLISNVFAKKDYFSLMATVFSSFLLVEIAAILHLFGVFIIPFDFAKSQAFNTIGSVGSLGFLAAILLPISVAMLILSSKKWKIFFGAQIVVSAVLLFLINYSSVWWAVAVGSVLIIIFGIIKRDAFDGRWLALPMFFLAVSLFFIFLNPQIPGLTQKVNEIYLTPGAGFKIALQSLKERPIFGSGPGTFYYDFSKFKNADFSKSQFWSLNFTQANSKVLTDLATTGIIGFMALLALIALPVFFGIKYLVEEKTEQKMFWMAVLGVVSALLAQAIMYFLYNANITITMIHFVLLGILVGFISKDKNEYELRSSSMSTLVITFAFTLAFIFGLGLLILDGQRYVAEAKYYNGISLLQNKNIDAGLDNIKKAAGLNLSSDLYFRQLSQIFSAKLANEMQNIKENVSEEQKAKLQGMLADSVNAAKIATDINPKNAANWSNRGYVYQTLFGLVNDAENWALQSYDEALKLDPNNPYLYAQQGNVNFISAQKNPDKKAELLAQAKEKLEKSISLNPNYSNGLYSLGLVYDALGQKDKAIEQFTKVLQIATQLGDKQSVAGIQKILDNLKAGLPALQQPTPPSETPPSDTEKTAPVPDQKPTEEKPSPKK
jgi:tetratricopeptide (TPR) repeat protein/O-antigen ligase